jgi:predicted transcriptional regulator
MKFLLISIKPEFVNKILSGKKIVELRKQTPNIKPDDFIIIYECSPTKAIVAIAKANDIISGTPEDIWSKIKYISGLTKDEYKNYYKDSPLACAIYLQDIEIVNKVTLETLRSKISKFQAPQSFRYLSQKQVNDILEKPNIASRIEKEKLIVRGMN